MQFNDYQPARKGPVADRRNFHPLVARLRGCDVVVIADAIISQSHAFP
jgi:hypothetical protein